MIFKTNSIIYLPILKYYTRHFIDHALDKLKRLNKNNKCL